MEINWQAFLTKKVMLRNKNQIMTFFILIILLTNIIIIIIKTNIHHNAEINDMNQKINILQLLCRGLRKML